jgi:hypothetical protein
VKDSPDQNRRRILKSGVTAATAAGFVGAGFSWPVQAAGAPQKFAGLKPLYQSKKSQRSSDTPTSNAVSAVPDVHIRALRRLTFGYKPEDLTSFLALDDNFDDRLQQYVDAQLNGYQAGWPPTNDAPLSAIVNDPQTNWTTLGKSLTTLWQDGVVADPPWPIYQYPAMETQLIAMNRAVYSEWQLAWFVPRHGR